jgi:hypothetical protein
MSDTAASPVDAQSEGSAASEEAAPKILETTPTPLPTERVRQEVNTENQPVDAAQQDASVSDEVVKIPDITAVEYDTEPTISDEDRLGQTGTDGNSTKPTMSDEDRLEQTRTDVEETGQRGGEVLPEATVPEKPIHSAPESERAIMPTSAGEPPPPPAVPILAARVYTAEDRRRSLEQKRKKKEQKLMRIYTAARERGFVTIAIARRVAKLKRTTALTYLNLLVTRGLLKRHGLGKKRRYVVV